MIHSRAWCNFGVTVQERRYVGPSCKSYSALRLRGLQVIGYFLTTVLYGILILQVCSWALHDGTQRSYTDESCLILADLYYISFPCDKSFQKALVYCIFVLNTVQAATFLRDAYFIFGTGFGNAQILEQRNLAGLSVSIITGLGSRKLFGCQCSHPYLLTSFSWLHCSAILRVSDSCDIRIKALERCYHIGE